MPTNFPDLKLDLFGPRTAVIDCDNIRVAVLAELTGVRIAVTTHNGVTLQQNTYTFVLSAAMDKITLEGNNDQS